MARIPHFDSLDTAQEGLVWGLFVFVGVSRRMMEWVEVLSALVTFRNQAGVTD